MISLCRYFWFGLTSIVVDRTFYTTVKVSIKTTVNMDLNSTKTFSFNSPIVSGVRPTWPASRRGQPDL